MNQKSRIEQEHWDDNPTRLSLLPLTEAQKRVLDERIDEHEANPDDVEPWEVARDEILEAARKRIHEGKGIRHEDFWEDAQRLQKKEPRKRGKSA